MIVAGAWLPTFLLVLANGRAILGAPATWDSYPPVPGTCQNFTSSMGMGTMSMLNRVLSTNAYDKYRRPNTAQTSRGDHVVTTDPDEIQVMLELKSIQRIDPVAGTVKISVKEFIQWTDPRLSFDVSTTDKCIIGSLSPSGKPRILLEPKDYSGGTKRIWTPEVYAVNKVDEFVSKELVYVYQTGLVSAFRTKTMIFACDMDFAQFPFDKQTCYVKIRDFAHAASEVKIIPGIVRFGKTELFDFSYSVSESVGTFLNQIGETKTTVEVKSNKRTVYAYLYFNRDQSKFWSNTFLADLLLNMAIWVSFWIPPQAAPARISLIIISFLAFRILMSALLAQLPPVTYSVWVLDYMAASQILAAAGLLQYAVLCYYAHKETSLSQYLKSVGKINLGKLLDEDGWSIHDLVEEASKVKSSLGGVIEAKSMESTSSGKVLTTEDEPRGASLDSAPTVTRGTSLDSLPDETGKPKSLSFEYAFVIMRTKAVFALADSDHSGLVSVPEFREFLRKLGKFYSLPEVCFMIEKFRTAQGSSLKDEPELDFEAVFRLLNSLDKFAPLELPALKKLHDKSPTFILDVQCRYIYPALVLIRTVFMLSIVDTYTM